MLILMLLFFLFFPTSAKAANEFKITQNILYSVSLSGVATVSEDVDLTNNYSQIYAKQYQINLSGSTIQNVIGSDSSGNIIDQVTTTGDTTNIFLKFSQPTIGKDQTNHFSINYSIPNFATKKGNTWEVQFPVFKDSVNSPDIQITLEVPLIFGELSFASTPISTTHLLSDKTQLIFSPKNPVNKILLVFGNHQTFDFTLNYFLKNSQNSRVSTQIPLPPDTNYQNIILSKIDPSPENIVSDSDGNWLAQYNLAPQQAISITVSGQAKIHPPKSNLTSINTEAYTLSQNFWPVTDPQIISLAQNLTNIKNIYQYVVNKLNYNYDQINFAKRQGALQALDYPNNSLCTEFTDLFITLARANKIPAREIEGFAYSNNPKVKPINTNSDVLHAWPEYFDAASQNWVQVDPTWEKTTNGIDYFTDLDLNHLTFVIHGEKSDSPPPPGSYQTTPRSKSVFVDFASTEISPVIDAPQINVEFGKVIIKNHNSVSLNHLTLSIDNVTNYIINIMPPFSTVSYDLPRTNYLQIILPQSQYYHFKFQSDELKSQMNSTIINRDHFFYLSIFIGFSIFILCFGGIIITTSFKSHEKNS